MKKIEVSPGEHLNDAAARLVEAAPATCEFNGITLTAVEGASAEGVVAFYNAESERRAKTYRESPEGREAERQKQTRVENLQAEADRLMARLSVLDFSNVAALLDWLSEIEDPRDHIGVKVDVPLIISTFVARGYQPNANCHEDFNESDPDNFARWIIGQAIQEPYYPGVRRFAEEWRERFGGALCLPTGVMINHTPELECATVTRQGLLVPEVLFKADGPDALRECQRYAREHFPDGQSSAGAEN